MGNNLIDIERARKTSLRMNLALLSGLSAVDAERGQVIVMDIHETRGRKRICVHRFAREESG